MAAGTLLGITQAELELYFGEHITVLAKEVAERAPDWYRLGYPNHVARSLLAYYLNQLHAKNPWVEECPHATD